GAVISSSRASPSPYISSSAWTSSSAVARACASGNAATCWTSVSIRAARWLCSCTSCGITQSPLLQNPLNWAPAERLHQILLTSDLPPCLNPRNTLKRHGGKTYCQLLAYQGAGICGLSGSCGSLGLTPLEV